MPAPWSLVTIRGQSYNLDHLVRYATHTGSREIGSTGHIAEDAEPVFGIFRYLELFFSDGSRVTLDGPQSQALLAFLDRFAERLDLDQIEEAALGRVLVHDTEAGDVILPAPSAVGPTASPIVTDPDDPDGPRLVDPRREVGDFPLHLKTDPADLLLTRQSDGNPSDSGHGPSTA